jgi:tripartite-type tricarboxylate transporter receptor subunit TctC
MVSSGKRAIVHVSGELFKMMAEVNMLHVPYRGAGPAVVDLIAGQVQIMSATMPLSIAYVRSGKLRALAVTSGGALSGIARPTDGR